MLTNNSLFIKVYVSLPRRFLNLRSSLPRHFRLMQQSLKESICLIERWGLGVLSLRSRAA